MAAFGQTPLPSLCFTSLILWKELVCPKTLLDANGAPRYNQPKYLGDPPGLAEWYDYHPYPKAWIEDERADIATMFCVSQKVAFRVRKELRSTSGKDNFGRSQLEGRIHFFYDEDSQPKRWTG